MVDPLSTAGSAAGIVSLGLQVCGGLISYCRAWRSRDKDIEEARERLTELELTLKHVAGILSVVEILDDNAPNDLRLAHHKIRSCTKNLNNLHSALIESEEISQPAGVLDRAHNIRLRSMYLFDKEKFKDLRSSVAETNINLGIASQFLLSHLETKRIAALEDLMQAGKNRIDKIPERVEQALVKRLELYGDRSTVMHEDMLNASLQQTQMMQHMTQEVAALQLGMILNPGLLQSVTQEERRMQSHRVDAPLRISQRCTCRVLYKYKSFGHSRSYNNNNGCNSKPGRWNATKFASTLTHDRGCGLYWEAQEAKKLGLRVSFTGFLLQGTVEAAISMTRGPGGCSISLPLTFNRILPSNSGPFKILSFSFNVVVSTVEMRQTFKTKKKEILRLYQEREALPGDVDENGDTVMHRACTIFNAWWVIDRMDSYAFELYFQFLQDLYELGVPLNRVNAAGLTPLGVLSYLYRSNVRFARLVTSMNLKMLDLGAEFPLFSWETANVSHDNAVTLLWESAQCPDLAEAFGCNKISQAVLAKSQSCLKNAILRNRELVNECNVIGQTPLHFSVNWPAGMQLLLKAGAAVNAIDNFGSTPIFYAARLSLQEPFDILAEKDSVLNTSSDSLPPRVHSVLSETIRVEVVDFERYSFFYRSDASTKDAEAIVDAIIRLVAKRRRTLESLVRTFLGARAAKRLKLSSEAVIDHKASLAVSMLREKTDVPVSLDIKWSSDSDDTVYHIPDLNLRQAHVLWDAGFRDIDELDNLGQSPLMVFRLGNAGWGNVDDLDLAEWLVGKGADLHCRQKYAFQKWRANEHHDDSDDDREIVCSHRTSSTTALHYLAAHWAYGHAYASIWRDWNFLSKSRALSETAGQIIRTVLTDSLPDCCNCRCSTEGCTAYTMWVKGWVTERSIPFIDRAQKKKLQWTKVLAQLYNVDQSSLAWLRHEMVRFNTFERLKLRHTCCRLGYMDHWRQVIYGPYDDEEKNEIVEEQAEQLEKLETLLVEFEAKYSESSSVFKEFLDGYWEDRMKEAMSEESPIDHDALEKLGITLRKTSRSSSCSSDDRVEELEESSEISSEDLDE
ncbi:MAG: hypothetical protein M1812_002678 [Candelaria pacifica]|nr:MAG: hypothetical protein M1812_002678 [Candelaria pacifica]